MVRAIARSYATMKRNWEGKARAGRYAKVYKQERSRRFSTNRRAKEQAKLYSSSGFMFALWGEFQILQAEIMFQVSERLFGNPEQPRVVTGLQTIIAHGKPTDLIIASVD